VSKSDSLFETAQKLEEARDVLRTYETSSLADVAATLSQAAESLAHTARELHKISREEWMTPDQAARHLNCTSTKAFQEVVAKEGVPRHYLSDRLPRYSRSELDEWLMGR
jgi:inorganic triphosphatase YgiF